MQEGPSQHHETAIDLGQAKIGRQSRFENVQIRRKDRKTKGCLSKKDQTSPPNVPLSKMLGRLDASDKARMVFGTICALLHGAALPVFAIAFGELFSVFYTAADDNAAILQRARIIAGIFCALGFWNLVFGTLSQWLWATVGNNLGVLMREEFFASVVHQDVGYFDQNMSGKLISMLTSDIEQIRNATGDKVASFLSLIGQALAGVIVGFVYAPALTGVLIAISPLMMIGALVQQLVVAKGAQSQAHVFAESTSLATEVIKGFRTVAAYVWQAEATIRYKHKLAESQRPRQVFLSAFTVGLSYLLIFGMYAIAMYVGALFVTQGRLGVGDLLVAFFSILIGAMGLGQAGTFLNDFSRGRGAAAAVVEVIKREPSVDPNYGGLCLSGPVEPRVEFRNVRFGFENRDQEVLKDISFTAQPGQTIGICGGSGAGKSTLVKLIERFYNVSSGSILVGGQRLEEFNIDWLRSQIGIVSQEPTLFNTTIRDNILIGKIDASQAEVEAAARAANAHDFIMGFPDGYDTIVGEDGGQMSGGQRQRICVARAILKNPPILILDEATASLDNQSEAAVQEALERASAGRTTFAIAHRLSTIQNSDMLLVMDQGRIVESGKHWELMLKKGLYYALQVRQMMPEELAELEISLKNRTIAMDQVADKPQ